MSGRKGKSKTDRWRCLTVGCNPILRNESVTRQHAEQTGHRTAKWPKPATPTRSTFPAPRSYEPHPFSAEALGQWE